MSLISELIAFLLLDLSHGQPLIVFLFAHRHVGILQLSDLLGLDFSVHGLVLFVLSINLLI